MKSMIICFSLMLLGLSVTAAPKLQLSVNSSEEKPLYRRNSTQWVLARPLSLEMLAEQAGIVFKGQLLKVKEAKDSKTGLNVREYKFSVDDFIKSEAFDSSQKQITLREWASIKSPLMEAVKANETYVFFFNKISSLGLTTLTGIEQGLVSFDSAGTPKLATRLAGGHDLSHAKASVNKSLSLNSNIEDKPKSYDELKGLCVKYMGETK